MHYAKLENSDRLQRVKDFLSDGDPHTTLDIIENATICAVNSAISELRANGLNINCWREGNKWFYQMHFEN